MVQIIDLSDQYNVLGPGVGARIVSAVEDAAHDLGDHVLIHGTVTGGISPEYGPIYIASGDRKVAS